MAYCTQEEIIKRFPKETIEQVTQDDRIKNSVDADRLNAAIFDSDALINSKLCSRYEVPLSPVPPEILRVAVDITVYFLYRARFGNVMPEEIKDSYKEALIYLEALKDGMQVLNAAVVSVKDEFIVLTNYDAHDRYYSKRKMRKIL